MDPRLRTKIAEFLYAQGVFEKKAGIGDALRGAGSKLKSLAVANRGVLGLAGGAAAMGGLSSLGNKEQKAQQEAEELNQLLEAYPELLYSTPAYGGGEEEQEYSPYEGGYSPY